MGNLYDGARSPRFAQTEQELEDLFALPPSEISKLVLATKDLAMRALLRMHHAGSNRWDWRVASSRCFIYRRVTLERGETDN
jgi:hypothetical protein